jgi:GTP cyclohydrolase I
VRTLLRRAGDDPAREGLLDSPNRLARAYREFFSGYAQDPHAVLSAVHDLPSGAFIVWTLAACALAWAWFNGVRTAKAA